VEKRFPELWRKQSGGDSMRIAITALGKEMLSPVDQRFGRARWFIVAETDTGEFESVDNEKNVDAAQGAGIQAARNVARLGVKAVVTGNVGPKAFAALKAAGIDVYLGANGTVREALEQFKTGALEVAHTSNVESHWA
jgi:predicted Fe-Mo cluster-binding NifX family protein